MTLRNIGAVAAIVVLALLIANFMPTPPAEEEQDHEHGATTSTVADTGIKPEITETRAGSGRAVEAGDMVTVHYDLYLADGKKIDSSRDDGKPYRFLLGGGMVMRGWDLGLEGARVGSARRIVVPPELGYGAQGSPDTKIPPNATLTFDVEVLKVEKIDDEPLLDPLLKGGPGGDQPAEKR